MLLIAADLFFLSPVLVSQASKALESIKADRDVMFKNVESTIAQ